MKTDLQDVIQDVREQVLYMRELGVESMDVQLVEGGELNGAGRDIVRQTARAVPADLSTPAVKTATQAAGSRLASLPSLSKLTQPNSKEESRPSDALFDTAPTLPEPVETVEQIRAEIGPDCTRCPLHALGRTRVVNSVGNFNADLMFAGEAPGADEDRLGEPFVGRAGQLLTKIIESIGLRREDVFIGNINRCRPPGNRVPLPEEAAVCKPYLLREIGVVRPKVIVVLGAHAAQNLLETKVPIGRLRGHFHDYLGVKVMPTFHPAYLLRDPNKKREVWDDMKMVRDYLNSV